MMHLGIYKNGLENPMLRCAELGAAIAGQFETFIGFGANLKTISMPAGPPVSPGRERTVIKILPLLQHLNHPKLPIFPHEGHRASALFGAYLTKRVSYELSHENP
jgi:hypothetical protein